MRSNDRTSSYAGTFGFWENGIATDDELSLVEDDPVVLEINEVQCKVDREKMLTLLARLRARLEEIDDGSYVVVDYETPFSLRYRR